MIDDTIYELTKYADSFIDGAIVDENRYEKSRQHGVNNRILKPKPNYNLGPKKIFRSQNKGRR